MQAQTQPMEAEVLNHLQQQATNVKDSLAHAIQLAALINDETHQQKAHAFLLKLQQEFDLLARWLNDEHAASLTAKVQQTIRENLNQLTAKLRDVQQADMQAEARTAIQALLLPVQQAYKNWLVVLSPSLEVDKQAERLRVEQASIELNETIRQAFYHLLAEIKILVEQKYTKVHCLLSYAIPSSHKPHEQWLPTFLQAFARHLEQAGIEVEIDRERSLFGMKRANLEAYIKRVDFTLLFGSESLVEEQQQGAPDVCAQLNAINDRRQQEKGDVARPFLIPILLSGAMEQSIPKALQRYSALEDFKASSYLGYLKRLLRYLLHASEQDEDFNGLWQSFETTYPLLAGGLPATLMEDYLATFYHVPTHAEAFQQATGVVNQWLEQSRNPVPAIWNAILPPTDYYTGRAEQLATLSQGFVPSSENAMVQTIAGLGGVGKTQLARQYVQQYRHRYELIWWFNADQDLDIAYLNLAAQLGLAVQGVKMSEVRDIVKNRLRRMPNWLLVFDNARSYEQLKDYIPQQHTHTRGHVLITSRNLSWPDALILHEFQAGEAIDLLWRIWTQDNAEVRLQHEPWDVAFKDMTSPLAEALGYLPLALVQAGVYIKESSLTFDEYLMLFREQRQALWDKGEHKPEDYSYTVATTWMISMQAVEKETPVARSLMQYCAFVSHADIPRYLVAQLMQDMFAENDAVRALQHYALVEANPLAETLSIHQLVQIVVRDAMEQTAQQLYLAFLIEVFFKIWPEFEEKTLLNLRQRRELLAHLAEIITHGKQVPLKNQNDLADAIAQLGATYLEVGDAKHSLEYSQQALAMQQHITQPLTPELMTLMSLLNSALEDPNFTVPSSEQIVKMQEQYNRPANPNLAMVINNVAQSYNTLGELRKALDYQLRALCMYQQLYKEPHPRIADSLGNLGTVYGALGMYNKQMSCHQKSLTMYQDLYQTPHPDIAMALNNVGEAYHAIGKTREAQEYLQEALMMYEDLNRINPHPDISAVLNNLGILYSELNDYQQALVYNQKSLQIEQRFYLKPHPNITRALNNVGDCYREIGDFEQAVKYMNEALAMAKQLYSPPHPYLAAIINNLAEIYKALGQSQQALEYSQQALAMVRKLYPEPNIHIASSLNNVGDGYYEQSDYQQALEYHQQALAMLEKLFSPPNLYIANSLNNLGEVSYKLGDMKQALAFFERALVIYQELFLDKPYSKIVNLLTMIGNIQYQLDEYNKALDYYQQALVMEKLISSTSSVEIAQAYYNVAEAHYALADYLHALKHYQQTLKIYQQIYPEPAHETAELLSDIAAAHHKLGQNQQAIASLQRALNLLEQIHQGPHQDMVDNLERMSSICYESGDSEQALEYYQKAIDVKRQLHPHAHAGFINYLKDTGFFSSGPGRDMDEETLNRYLFATLPDDSEEEEEQAQSRRNTM